MPCGCNSNPFGFDGYSSAEGNDRKEPAGEVKKYSVEWNISKDGSIVKDESIAKDGSIFKDGSIAKDGSIEKLRSKDARVPGRSYS